MLKIVATNPLGKRYSMLNLPILLSSTRNVGEQVVQQERAFHVANPLCGIGVTGPRCRSAVFGSSAVIPKPSFDRRLSDWGFDESRQGVEQSSNRCRMD